jgi:hypothetical protein
MAQYQAFLGGGQRLGAAVLRLGNVDVPCTHTEIVGDFELEAGQKATTFVERCEFLANDVGAFKPVKGAFCSLRPNSSSDPVPLRLWHGGLQPGGLIYRFMLVDRNYRI